MAVLPALGLCLAAPASLLAQIVGSSVNMVSGTQWPGGDPFLQRQNGPSMAVSTRNPLHLLAGDNDYRTVDLPGLPNGSVAGDAWLGVFQSLDGGKIWTSTLLPGFPQDTTPAGLTSPAHGFQAGTDPVMRPGTNGLFYYAGLVFNRTPVQGGQFGASAIVVSRFLDNNASTGNPIQFLDTAVVAQGAPPQTFVDKPWIAVDVPRAGARMCNLGFAGGNVYVTYTLFQGDEQHGAILFQRSTDCGVTWGQPIQFADNTGTRQGTAIAVDPNTGAVYVTWRQFAGFGLDDAIYVVKSVDGGQTFTAAQRVASITPFDQGSSLYSFRTNSYPAIAVDNAGRVYIAWSQRGVGPGGDARIAVSTSLDGQAWTAPSPADNQSSRGHQFMPALTFAAGQLMLIYYDLRDDSTEGVFAPLGGGVYSESRQPIGDLAAGAVSTVFSQFVDDTPPRQLRHTLDVRVAQASPAVVPAFSSARVSSYNFGSIPGFAGIQQLQVDPPDFPMFAQGTQPYIGDYLDISALMFITDANGNWVFNSAPANDTVFHAAWTDNRDVRPPQDGNWANYTPVPSPALGPFSLFDPTQLTPGCVIGQEGSRNQNIYTAAVTQGLAVSSPNNSKALSSQLKAFVVTVENTSAVSKTFRLTILNQPTGGRAVFSQSSNSPLPLTRLDITIPAESTVARSVFVSSTVPQAKVRILVQQITAPNGAVVAGGLQSTIVLNADLTDPNLGPNSGNPSSEIYTPSFGNPNIANPNIANPNIANPNIANPNIANPNIANPNIANPNIANPNIANPNIANPNIANPNIANPNIANPNIANPNIANPNISAGDLANGTVTDVTWTFTNTGNTAMAYTVKTLLNGQIPAGFVTQLIANQVYATPVAYQCQLGVDLHTKLIANIVNPVFEQASANDAGDPSIANSASNDPTVALSPGETISITLRIVNPDKTTNTTFDPASTFISAITSHGANTQPLQQGNPQPPVAASQVIILTQTLPAATVGSPYAAQLMAAGGTGAITWSSSNLPASGLSLDAASGIISGTPTGTAPSLVINVTATDSGLAPKVANRSYTLTIISSPPPAIASTSLPTGYPGVNFAATLISTGGATPKTWSVTVGTLPAGLSLNASTGAIAGLPGAAGSTNLTFTVTDALGRQASKVLTLTIAPITLAFTQQPVNATAFVPDSVQIKATNAAGVGLAGVQLAVAIVLSNGTTVNTLNLTTATGGTVSSTLSLASGVYHLTASVTGAPTATSNTFTVTGSPLLTFVVQPGTTNTGQVITPPIQVAVRDASGAVIPGMNVTLAIGANPGGGALSGTLTVVTNATGIATFANVSIDKAGAGYTLAASATGAPNAVSNPFTVNLGTGGITTIAGSTWVFTGGGGPAANAPLGLTFGVVTDAAGNVYAADFNNAQVYKISPAGTLNVIAGTGVAGYGGDNGPATSAMLNGPMGLTLDSGGNLFVTEYLGSRVRKVTAAGVISTVAGTGTPGFSGDNGPASAASVTAPIGIVTDPAGNLYFSDGNRVRKVDATGIITTIAGTGSPAFNGDGPATTASLAVPSGIAFDPSGALIIVDSGHDRIRRLAGGNLTTIAGNGSAGFTPDGTPALNSQLGNTFYSGLAVDGAGNIVFSDSSRLRKINAAGILSTLAGDGVNGFSGDGGPAIDATISFVGGVASDSAGNLYFGDPSNERVRKIDTSGTITTFAGNGQFSFGGDGGPATSAFLTTPQGLAVDSAGNILVGDFARVRRFAVGGLISTVAGNGIPGFSGNGGSATNAQLNTAGGVAADPAGNFYLSDLFGARARKVDSLGIITEYAGSGSTGFGGDGGPATEATLNPNGMATDASGNLYLADRSNNRVRKVSSTGIITTVAGNGTAGFSGDGGPAVQAALNNPGWVTVDSAGNLYISDAGNQRVRMVEPSGLITTIAGNGTAGFSDGIATASSLNSPQGLATDPAGNLFIADQGNQRIRKVDAGGNMTTVAGNGTAGFSGDGGAATLASLSGPVAVAIDASGNLLISDSGNSRVRRVVGAGTLGGAQRLTITTTSLPAANAGAPYSATLTATGGAGTLNWTIVSGSLPGGLSLGLTTGQITGTATMFGAFNFTVQVKDGVHTALANLTIQSNLAAGSGLVFVSQPVNTGAGQTITPQVQVKAQDNLGAGIPGVNVVLAIANNASGGTLSGTLTVMSGASGIANFPNLSINRAGNNYTLSATAASAVSVSQAFRVLPAAGGIITVAGSNWVFTGAGGPAISAPIGPNQGVALDSVGNRYFADTGNHMVFKVSNSGVLNVVAGTGIGGFSGDGGPATSAQLNSPQGVAVDAGGNVYVSDTSNNRVRKIDSAGIITTYAGTGVLGFGGDNSPAVGASMRSPQGLGVDGSGNLYIADANNHRVRRVTPAGIISTVAGNGTANFAGDGLSAQAASLNTPRGVALDSSGNLFIADSNNHRIRKVSGGVITTVAGGLGGFFGDGGPAIGAGVGAPSAVFVDNGGNIYFADNNTRVRQVVTSGTISTIAGNGLFTFAGDGGQGTAASLAGPAGLVGDNISGNGYFNDSGNRRVRKVDPSGVISTLAGNGNFKFAGDGGLATSANLWGPLGVTPDNSGNLYIADSSNARIRKVDAAGVITTIAGNGNFSNGNFSASGAGGPALNAVLSNVSSNPRLDAAGNLYFADTGNNRILKIDTSGTISTFAGNGNNTFSGDGGPATAAGIGSPFGLALDVAGNVYISDSANNRIRKVDASGIITTAAGNGAAGFSGDGGPATLASLSAPIGVAVDAAGNVYFSDANNNRVRMVSPSGTITTVAGTGVAGFSGDGGLGTSANLSFPAGLTVDAGGNVYVSDVNNGRVRRIDLAGAITTIAGGGNSFGDGGPATSAQLSRPGGISFDAAGNLFIPDQGSDRIREVAALGTLAPNSRLTITTTSLPNTTLGGAYSSPLQAVGGSGVRNWTVFSGALPGGVTLDPASGLLSGPVTGAGTFFFTIQVTDSGQTAYGSFTVQANLLTGSTVAFVTSPGTIAAGSVLNPPPQVRVLDATLTPIAGATVTISVDNNPGGAALGGTTSSLTGGSGIASFSTLTLNKGGNEYTLTASVGSLTAVSQPFNVIPGAGNIMTVAGTPWLFSGAPGPALNMPIAPGSGAVIDAAGNLIISDGPNHQIEKITPAGVLSVIAGTGVAGSSGDGGPALSAQLNNPAGLALDATGSLLVADMSANRVRKIDSQGIITTIAGIGNFDFFGDGGPAQAAAFRGPAGVAVDAAGNIYVADRYNQRIRKINTAGLITTVAGNGTQSFSGDTGPALNASLFQPVAVIFDSLGNLLIADNGNNRIRSVSQAGIISTLAGSNVCCTLGDSGPAGNAWISGPQSLALDGSGNLFFADQFNQRIRKITPGGIISTVAGSGARGFSGDGGTATSAQFDQPTGVAVDLAGDLYVLDSINKRVRKVDTSGNINTIAGNGLFKFNGDGAIATSTFLDSPQGVTVDASGNLYISDNGNLRVRQVSPAGIVSTLAGTGVGGFSGDSGPSASAQIGDFTTDLRIDAGGNLLVADDNNGRVRKITPGGVITSAVSGINPRSVAADAAGNIYIAQDFNNTVIKVDSLGTRSTVAGTGVRGFSGDGGPATAAQLNGPRGVALDRAGNLYIVDSFNSRIRRVTPGGIITTLAGTGFSGFSGDGGPATSALVSGNVTGIQTDAGGNVYIADTSNNRIRKIDLTGIITTVAGSGTFGYAGDGGPATSANLASPSTVEIDANGNLYIADTSNDRIREVLAPGPPPLPNSRLTITTTRLVATAGTPVVLNLQATGGTNPLTWNVVAGSLPANLVFNNGQITGSALAAGTVNITVQVHDSGAPQQTTLGIVVVEID
ncbi:MAG: putative Ig domain-containing protein [Acidobacteriia bacterium]|nr:putative Ig domain-containing protein [Terriglobia bacterium]